MAHVAKLFSTTAHFWSLGVTKNRFWERFFFNPNATLAVFLQSFLLTFVVKLLAWGKKFAFKTLPCLKEKKGPN